MLTIGIENNPSIYRWTVKTIYGNLRVDIHKNDFNLDGSPRIKSNPCFGIYTSFEAKEISPELKKFINDFYHDWGYVNGKWNFHCSANCKEDWDYLVNRFKYELDKILVKS
jgi:hypothetical protein